MHIKFNQEKKQWVETDEHDPEGRYFHDLLFQKVMNVDKIRRKNWDCIILIDGVRRGGKSTMGLQIAKLLNPYLTINNVGSGLADTKEKITNLPDGDVLLIDEGSLVFNSKDSLRRENVELGKIVDVVGQKRLTLIIVLPLFFDLAKPIATAHSRFLIHVYTDEELNRGRFAYFGEGKKRILYTEGKRNYNSYKFPESDFTGKFRGWNPLGEEYLELKKKSLLEALHSNEGARSKQHEMMRQRDKVVRLLNKQLNYSKDKLKSYLKDNGLDISEYKLGKILENVDGNS